MMDTSPADDNGRLYDYADANDSDWDDDWEPVADPARALRWFEPCEENRKDRS